MLNDEELLSSGVITLAAMLTTLKGRGNAISL
jgi:hypothetical protein